MVRNRIGWLLRFGLSPASNFGPGDPLEGTQRETERALEMKSSGYETEINKAIIAFNASVKAARIAGFDVKTVLSADGHSIYEVSLTARIGTKAVVPRGR